MCEAPESAQIRVLVADDDPSLRLALTLVFQRAGHTVVTAEDTESALEIVAGQGADVAVIDAGMPRDGVAFWKECREGDYGLAGALLVTGDIWALGDLARHEMVLEKPFDFRALVERVERFMQPRRPTDQPPLDPG